MNGANKTHDVNNIAMSAIAYGVASNMLHQQSRDANDMQCQ